MGAPLAGPGPYTADVDNPGILAFYKVNSAEFHRWKNEGHESLREMFLRQGSFDWWWFAGVQQHDEIDFTFILELNGGPVGIQRAPSQHYEAALSVPSGTWMVDRFETDIIARPHDFFEIYAAADNGPQTLVQIGTITVPPHEYWVLVAWKVRAKPQEE